MNWFSHLYYSVFDSLFGFIGTPTIAIITLVAVNYGLTKHRSLWWIIPCAVISLAAFTITGLILYSALANAMAVGG